MVVVAHGVGDVDFGGTHFLLQHASGSVYLYVVLMIWVVVPVFNEERALDSLLTRLGSCPYNVVVVDDGSTDTSSHIAKKYPVTLLSQPSNLGQGAALRRGIEHALEKGAEFLVTMDSDGQMHVEDIPSLLAPVQSGACDLALGNRFGNSELRYSGLPFLRKHLLKFGTWVLWIFSGLKLQDSQNGFRAFSRAAAQKIHIRQDRMAHNWEILFQAAKQKLRVQEVPVRITYSQYSLEKGQKLKNVFHILWDLLIK